MKRVIGGRMYDTGKAQLLGEADPAGSDIGSFHWYEESLYRSTRGAYFLAGYGHAMSPWAESVGQNAWGPGEGIRPLTEAEAREWMETHATTKEYEDAFGSPLPA